MGATTGEKYACEECGLEVTVSNDCSCEGICDLVCCEKDLKRI